MSASHPPAATGQVLSHKLDRLGDQLASLTKQIKLWRLEHQATLARISPSAAAAVASISATAEAQLAATDRALEAQLAELEA